MANIFLKTVSGALIGPLFGIPIWTTYESRSKTAFRILLGGVNYFCIVKYFHHSCVPFCWEFMKLERVAHIGLVQNRILAVLFHSNFLTKIGLLEKFPKNFPVLLYDKLNSNLFLILPIILIKVLIYNFFFRL